MKKETYILFTSGRGPLECGLAVQGIQKRFKNYLDKHKVPYEIVNQKTGDIPRSIETIVFKLQAVDKINLKPWLGTHLWHCKSPIRKFHKRKNWYIKCQELVRPQEVALTLSNVVVNTFRASGPGGQHRNKVETAVRIIHNPTGIIVTASDGKSQAQNKKKAEVDKQKAKPTPVYDGKYQYHIVKSGDNLWDIANKYKGVSVKQLQQLNKGLNYKNLKLGSKLKIKPLG